MLGRMLLATLVLGLAATAVPVGPVAVESASASCLYVAEVDECVNPCITAQRTARRLGLPISIACTA